MNTDILLKFKTQLLLFIDELIQQFPHEGDFVIFKLFIANQMPIQTAMELFRKQLDNNEQRVRKMIELRLSDFFFVSDNFPFISASKLEKCEVLWNDLDVTDATIMWTWIDSIVKLADKYSM